MLFLGVKLTFEEHKISYESSAEQVSRTRKERIAAELGLQKRNTFYIS